MLNVLANLWGLNSTNNTNASPVAKKKKRKNHHKKNKSNEAKGTDIKSSISNDDEEEEENVDDVEIVVNKKNIVSNNNDDIDDLYKADIKDVSHQIIEAVRALAKKDHRCINKDVSELFSDKYISEIITYMFEGGYEYDHPDAIFNTIIDNNHREFYDDNGDDGDDGDDDSNTNNTNGIIESVKNVTVSSVVTNTVIDNDDPIKPMDNIITNSHSSISADHHNYLTFLLQLDEDRIPNQLELLVINSNVEENLNILCSWFEKASSVTSKDVIFLKTKALETIFERFFSSAECFKTEKIKAAFTKLLKLLFTTSSSAASGNFISNVTNVVNDIVINIGNLSSQLTTMSSYYSSDGKRKASHFIGIKIGQIIRNLIVRMKSGSAQSYSEGFQISKFLEGVDRSVSKLIVNAKKLDAAASIKDKFDAREVGHEIVGMFLNSLEEMRKEIAKNSRRSKADTEANVTPLEDERSLEMSLLEYSGENMSSLMSNLSQKSQVKSNLDNLRSEKEKKVNNLKADTLRLNSKVNELKLEQQALLNKIHSIDNEINEILGATKILDNKIQEVNIGYEKEMNLLAQNPSQKGVISAIQFQESVSKVVDNIKSIENDMNRLFSADGIDKSKSAEINITDEYNKWLNNSLEPLRSYMISESICVKFLADRIVQNLNMMETLKVEKDNFVKLKMNSMANNLQTKIKDIEEGIEEDRNALVTIQAVITQTLFRFVQSFTVSSFNAESTKLIIPSEPLSTIIKSLKEAGVSVKNELSAFFTASTSSSSPR